MRHYVLSLGGKELSFIHNTVRDCYEFSVTLFLCILYLLKPSSSATYESLQRSRSRQLLQNSLKNTQQRDQSQFKHICKDKLHLASHTSETQYFLLLDLHTLCMYQEEGGQTNT